MVGVCERVCGRAHEMQAGLMGLKQESLIATISKLSSKQRRGCAYHASGNALVSTGSRSDAGVRLLSTSGPADR
jgi:hypothetical protein